MTMLTSAPGTSTGPTSTAGTRTRALRVLAITLVIYIAAVATHAGEFWPFSIYPMFSRAGRPWTRALVVQLEPDTPLQWGPWRLQGLPGKPYPGSVSGVSTNDLSELIQRTTTWDEARVAVLYKLFATGIAEGRTLMLLRSDGHYNSGTFGETDGSVDIKLTGVVRFGPAGTGLNPELVSTP